MAVALYTDELGNDGYSYTHTRGTYMYGHGQLYMSIVLLCQFNSQRFLMQMACCTPSQYA